LIPSQSWRPFLLAIVVAAGAFIASPRTGHAQPPVGETPGSILPRRPTPLDPDVQLPRLGRVLVQRVKVEGSTVFSEAELAAVTQRYVGRYLGTEDLEALRLELTRLYVDRGYVNSGAVLPDQTVTDGVVTYRIVEGAVTDVNITGNRWFRTGYLRRRLTLGGTPLNVNDLQRDIQQLLEDPRIARLSADLKPGLRPGESVLDVRVEDRQPFRLLFDINNYQNPSVGAERGIVTLEDVNLLGLGDVLTLRYGRSDGLDPLLDFRYAIPVTARDTTLSFQYRRDFFSVIEEPFTDLNIETKSEIFTLGVRQPVYRSPSTTAAVEFIGERLSLNTTLLGEPFPLLPGSHNGEEAVTALRAVQEFVYRTQNQAIALRSRFSFGIDALGATINSDPNVPDGRFFAWLGQAQWVRRLPILDSQVIVRSDLQLTPDPLLTLEQFTLGGRYTVRGYRENGIVRDNAYVGGVEFRVPVVRNVAWADYVELAPFYDYGRGWNTVGPTPDPIDISSVGMGLRWALTFPGVVSVRPSFEVYFGYRLRDVRILGQPDTLQDVITTSDRHGEKGKAGIHFQFLLAVF
jgi:hemolysin activation/secretion protein